MTSALATRQFRVSSAGVAILIATALAWILTLVWINGADMVAMPGTMGMSVVSFTAMWGLMMAAMMLPSMAPFLRTYQATVVDHRGARLSALALGYLLVWTAVGLVAYVVADRFDQAAARSDTTASVVAAAVFGGVGLFQFTPLKYRCLSHCRSPVGHLMHYLGFRGRTRDLRAGASHGLFCLGCCWALMVLMIAFGVMNVTAMVGLATVIAIEKLWRHGERFARVVGAACLVFAVLVLFEPGLARGLDPDATMMPGMSM